MRNLGKSRAPLLFLEGGIRGAGVGKLVVDEFFEMQRKLAVASRQIRGPRPWLPAKKGRSRQ